MTTKLRRYLKIDSCFYCPFFYTNKISGFYQCLKYGMDYPFVSAEQYGKTQVEFQRWFMDICNLEVVDERKY